MSKLGIVAALALVTTVGGVYAAWNYAEGTMQKITSPGKKIEITVADATTPSGSILFHNSLALWIDNEGGKEGSTLPNYTPGWDDYYAAGGEGYANAGELIIEFSPAASATNVTLQYTLYIKEGTNKYVDWDKGNPDVENEVKIFNVGDDSCVVTGEFTYDFTKPVGAELGVDADGKKIYNGQVRWSYEEFIALFPVNQSFTVSTKAEYDHFADTLKDLVIHADVEEI